MRPKLIPAVAAERLVTGGPTGLIWENPVSRRLKPGDAAGYLTLTGHYQTRLEGLKLLNHRVAWFLHYGEQPPECLDHINGNPSDNRIENLRPATHSQNQWNRPASSNNTSGFKGVSLHRPSGRWTAECMVRRQRHRLGYYTTPEEAAEAVTRFREQHHGDFANHG